MRLFAWFMFQTEDQNKSRNDAHTLLFSPITGLTVFIAIQIWFFNFSAPFTHYTHTHAPTCAQPQSAAAADNLKATVTYF